MVMMVLLEEKVMVFVEPEVDWVLNVWRCVHVARS